MPTIRDLVQQRIAAALDACFASGALQTPEEALLLPPIEVTRPHQAEHGDFATNLALQLAGKLRKPPRDVAAALVGALAASEDDELIVRAESAGPGFVNLWLAPATSKRPWTRSAPPASATDASRPSIRARSTSSSCRPIRRVH
jgi:arginyl-tRNA synthetase